MSLYLGLRGGFLGGLVAPVVTGNATFNGQVKAQQFRATQDGDSTQFAYTWDADPNIGLRRTGADNFTIGVAANQPVAISQFTATFGEGMQGLGGFILSNYSTDTLAASTQNNYAAPGWNASRAGMKITCTGAVILTGIAAVSNGCRQRLWNAGTANNLTLNHSDAGSNAGNRFYCPNAVAYVLAPGEGVEIEYDTALFAGAGGWRVCGTV